MTDLKGGDALDRKALCVIVARQLPCEILCHDTLLQQALELEALDHDHLAWSGGGRAGGEEEEEERERERESARAPPYVSVVGVWAATGP